MSPQSQTVNVNDVVDVALGVDVDAYYGINVNRHTIADKYMSVNIDVHVDVYGD